MKLLKILLIISLPLASRAMDEPDSDVEDVEMSEKMDVDRDAAAILSSLSKLKLGNANFNKSNNASSNKPILTCYRCGTKLLFQNDLNTKIDKANTCCGRCRTLSKSK